jgi:outer membrane biosynthesis protein TonB
MRIPTAVRWTGLALLGILIAAAVSVAASRLASQQIGLASEPISAGDALAPAMRQQRATAPKHGPVKPTKHPQQGVPSVPAQPTEPAPAQPTEPAPAPTPPVEAPEPSHPGGDGERGEGGADD